MSDWELRYPVQAGAGRMNYWADRGSEDNEVRANAVIWKEDAAGLAGCGGCGGPTTATDPTRFPDCAPGDEPQGPTDEGVRCASCWNVNNLLPSGAVQPGSGGFMDGIMRGGRRVHGFDGQLADAPDPFDGLTAAQQQWVLSALVDWLNNTPSGCAALPSGSQVTVPTNRVLAVMCFQAWWNTGAVLRDGTTKLNPQNLTIAYGQAGVFTQDTLGALATAMQSTDYAPGAPGVYPQGPTEKPTGWSTGAKVAVGVAAGLALLGGGYALTRKRRAA